MENLPKELVSHIFSFVPVKFLNTCSKYHYLQWLDESPRYHLLLQWVFCKKRLDLAKQKLRFLQLEILSYSQMSPAFSHFRHVDQHFLRRCTLEGEKEHWERLIHAYEKKTMYFQGKLGKFFTPSRLDRFYQNSVVSL